MVKTVKCINPYHPSKTFKDKLALDKDYEVYGTSHSHYQIIDSDEEKTWWSKERFKENI